MRASFDPGREYLWLDGLSNGGHKHDDGNSISRITDRGRIWLADNDYIRSLPKFHNSLLVFKDGQAVAIPAYCELEAAADGPQQGLSRTVVRNYNGVDWHRTIVWNKGKCFLVFDDLVAQEAADFDFHCLWHTVGEVRLTAEGLEVEQKGPRFFVKNAPGVQLKLSHDAELGRNWAGYPFAKPVVHSLRQVKSVRLAKGQRAGFANLLYASDDATPQQFAIAGGDNGRVSVTDAQGKLLALVINYACHNTTLRGNFKQIHGDWAACAQESIEADHPGAVAMVTIGCGADSDPCPHSTVELCQRHGRDAAEEVKRLLAGPFRPISPKLVARMTPLILPYDKLPPREELEPLAKKYYPLGRLLKSLERGDKPPTSESYRVAVWAFGDDLAMIFLADEVVVDYALRMKREFDGSRLWINAYSNDVSRYVASNRLLKEGGYEVNNSLGALVTYGKPDQMQPLLEDRIIDHVRSLLPPSFAQPR